MNLPLRISLSFLMAVVAVVTLTLAGGVAAETLKTHRIFSSNMVIQRDKPIRIWGWAEVGREVPRRFSIADKSGKFYMAHAAYPLVKDAGIWNVANKNFDATKIVLWSPLVAEPVAVRYAWATSPMGNAKVNGKQWLPLPSFRTDDWDWPESEDPSENAVSRGDSRAMNQDAAERLNYRKTEEAKRAVEILERLRTLGKTAGKADA